MAYQTTPHTQSQQNRSAVEDDLEPNQLVQDVGQGDDAELYANSDGAQTGGTRAFNANAAPANTPRVLQESAAMTGHVDTRSPHGEGQGITNHSVNIESERQEKVVAERPDAQAGVNLTGHPVRK